MSKRKKTKLKRAITLFEATLAGVGIIVGAGIYALIGQAAALAGNAVWISFTLAASVAILTGLSYCELSSMFPWAGAEYVYTERAFGKRLAFFLGFFLITAITIAASAVSLGFAGYMHSIFGTPIVLTAVILILACLVLLLYGVEYSILIGVLFTFVGIAGLLFIIVMGLPRIGSINPFENPFGFSGIFSASALIFFAYIGFEEIVNMAEETENAIKNVPIAVILAIIISTILYVLASLSSVSVMGWEALGASTAPLADVAGNLLGSQAFIVMSVVALFSTANTVLLVLLANTRLTFGMVRDLKLSKTLSWVHPKTKTPWVAIFVICFFSILFIFLKDIRVVADLTNMAIFITFIIINSSAIALRIKKPDIERPFKIWGSIKNVPIVSVLGIISNIILLNYVGFHAIKYGVAFFIIAFVLYEVLERTGRVA